MAGKKTKPVIDLEGLPTEPVWYVVITKHNYEQAYAVEVEKGLVAKGLEDNIIECLVPIKETKTITVDKKGREKEKITKEKIYPNCVFVKAIMNETVWDYLRTRNGASTILAPDGTPAIVSNGDIERTKKLANK